MFEILVPKLAGKIFDFSVSKLKSMFMLRGEVNNVFVRDNWLWLDMTFKNLSNEPMTFGNIRFSGKRSLILDPNVGDTKDGDVRQLNRFSTDDVESYLCEHEAPEMFSLPVLPLNPELSPNGIIRGLVFFELDGTEKTCEVSVETSLCKDLRISDEIPL